MLYCVGQTHGWYSVPNNWWFWTTIKNKNFIISKLLSLINPLYQALGNRYIERYFLLKCKNKTKRPYTLTSFTKEMLQCWPSLSRNELNQCKFHLNKKVKKFKVGLSVEDQVMIFSYQTDVLLSLLLLTSKLSVLISYFLSKLTLVMSHTK